MYESALKEQRKSIAAVELSCKFSITSFTWLGAKGPKESDTSAWQQPHSTLQGCPQQTGVNVGTGRTKERVRWGDGGNLQWLVPALLPEQSQGLEQADQIRVALGLLWHSKVLLESAARREDFINSYFRYHTHYGITFLTCDLSIGISWFGGWGFLLFVFLFLCCPCIL